MLKYGHLAFLSARFHDRRPHCCVCVQSRENLPRFDGLLQPTASYSFDSKVTF
jgi:hypothetical protein